MKIAIIVSEGAKKELRVAKCWHEAEHYGRGNTFIRSVNAQLREIAKFPDRWPEDEGVRQSPVPGWDMYSIYYAILKDHIRILSVFHAAREPKDW